MVVVEYVGGQPPLGGIVIGLRRQLPSPVEVSEEVGLDVPAVDVGVVAPPLHRRAPVVLEVGVIATDMGVVAAHAQRQPLAQTAVEPQCRVDETETAPLERRADVDSLARERGTGGLDCQGAGRSILPGRHHHVILLPARQGDSLNSVEGKASEVYLSRLRVGDWHAVKHHAGVRRTEAAH